MKSIPLRRLLREPVKVKRLTLSGQSVQVNLVSDLSGNDSTLPRSFTNLAATS